MHRFISLIALTLACSLAEGLTFRLNGDDVVGHNLVINTVYEDTFVDLGKRYGLGYRELIDANPGVLPWVPGEGTELLLPLSFILPNQELKDQEETVVLNLAEFRLYHFIPDRGIVRAYAVGIGKAGWGTPNADTEVTGVIENPSWSPPESIRLEQAARGIELPSVVPAGPDNPLGEYAVLLSLPGYLFHGSNKQLGIGMRVSHGCVRLYDSDIEELALSLKPGTRVKIINEPVKVGWKNDQLFLEVHKPLEEDVAGETDIESLIASALSGKPGLTIEIDWEKVKKVLRLQSGSPALISQ